MPRNPKTSSSNGHAVISAKKSKEKPTYKIIVLGSGGVGKVSGRVAGDSCVRPRASGICEDDLISRASFMLCTDSYRSHHIWFDRSELSQEEDHRSTECFCFFQSAITIQFVKSFFFSDYDPTIEDSYVKQCLIDNQIAQLEILDSAGQEEFKPMRDQYVRVGEGFLLVFSLTDRRSLDECYKLHRDILRIKDTDNVPMLLVGNKLDLRQTGMDGHARAAAATMRIPYFETSARTRCNIDEIFVELVRIIRRNKAQAQANSNASVPKNKKRSSENHCCSCEIL